MQVKLEKKFTIDAPANITWKIVQDVKAVAACMPGAEITEQVDDSHYRGRIKVKVGPVGATFGGQLEVVSMDQGKMEGRVRGKGADEKGASSAAMELTAAIRPIDAGRCEVTGLSEVTVTGKLASFGGRMMTQVADQMMQQFSANLNNFVVASAAGANPGEIAAQIGSGTKEINVIAMLLAIIWNAVKKFLKRLGLAN